LVLLKPIAVLSLCLQVLLLSGCTNFIFQPNNIRYYTPEKFNVSHEEVFFKTRDGLRLHGWWLKSEVPKKANIVFIHGNAQNISSHIANVAWLTKEGYDVFIFDYRGYGYSQGVTEIEGVIHDAIDAIAYGAERSAKENVPVIVLGQSLGGSLAIYAVANSEYKEKILVLITISAFSDYHEITQEALSTWWLTWAFQWPLSFTINNDYRPLDYVSDIYPVPFVVMHSQEDEVIPYHHGSDLIAAAKQPKTFVEITGTHNYTFAFQSNKDLLAKYIAGFLKQ